jgi:hypothetical protein
MHGGGNIQRKHSRIGVSGGKLACAEARAAACIDNEIGRIFNVIESRQHAIQYLALQDRCPIIPCRGAVKRFSHLAFIDYMAIVHVLVQRWKRNLATAETNSRG